MSGKSSGVILFAQTGRLSAGLKVLLKSLFPLVQIEQIETVDGLYEILAGDISWLVLIDADFPSELAWIAAERIQQNHNAHYPILLVHQSRQVERAHAAGLQSILLDGMTAASLSETISPYLHVTDPN
ncbi:MAG: hypothetical protein LWX83_01510 [Anaerolineae bacterium]|nr:hypothetical protein [Anaerolineae bacterium]